MLTWLRRLARRARALTSGAEVDRELNEEIRLHIELETEELMRSEGLPREEARRRALVAFGGVARYREEHRDARGVSVIAETRQDVHYAVRGFIKRPGFTLAAIATLALGIGANTAVFSAVDSLIMHPLPFPHSTAIVYVWTTSPKGPMSVTPPRALADAWVAHPGPIRQIEEYTGERVKLSTPDGSEDVQASYIGSTYLAFLGLHPVLGRGFSKADLADGAPGVAMLGYGAWKARYGASPDVLGRTMQVNGRSYTIVGVAPALAGRLDSPGDVQLWLPFRRDLGLPDGLGVRVAARVPDGMSDAQVATALTAVMRHVPDLPPFMNGWKARLFRPQDFLLGSLHTTLLVLLAVVGLVLLIACANVASLLLGRAAARAREMAVRTALGASRARLVRQLLTESTLLAALGGGAGIGVAVWGLRMVARWRPESLADLDGVRLDPRAVWFTAGAVIAATLIFGLLPSMLAADTRPADALKAGSGIGRFGKLRGRTILTAGQTAISVILLIGAGLLIRTLGQLERVDPGFRPAGLVAVQVALPKDHFPDSASVAQFIDRVATAGPRLVGVGRVTVSAALPLGYGITGPTWQVEGGTLPADLAHAEVAIAPVPPDYFSVLGIPLLEGRTFASARERSVVVSRDFAHAVAPAGSAIGQRVRSGGGDWLTIVGVAGDVAGTSMRDESTNRYQVYEPFSAGILPAQAPLWLLGRTTGGTETAIAGISSMVRSLDRSITISRATTGDGLIHQALAASRFYALVLAAFALLALVLAAVGLFGVLSYGVQQQSRDIGIRMALGARARDVQRGVVVRALLPVTAGLAAGIGLSFPATRVLASLLYGVRPIDPPTLVGVTLIMLITALLASYLPARTAARVDPVRTLRAE